MMKPKVVMLITLLLLFGLLIGCSSDKPAGNQPAAPAPGTQENQAGDSGKSAGKASGKVATMTEFADEWDRVYELHEKAINNYEIPVLEIATAPLPLVTGPLYEILNMDNKDGRHEGVLALSGIKAFIEKKGSKSIFGYDTIREKDGFGNSKAGDRMVEDGIFEADRGYIRIEDRVERDGKAVSKVFAEYVYNRDSVFRALYQYGSEFDGVGRENKLNTVVFLLMGEKQYDFVVANAETGATFEVLALKENMSAEEAKELLSKAGYQIKKTGGIQAGVFTMTTP